MIELPELPSGIYQHYKGNFYQVFGYAHDANTDESFYKRDGKDAGMRVVVVYIGLELNDAHTGPRLAVRSVDDFFMPVCWNAECDRYGSGGEQPSSGFCSLCTQPHAPRFTYHETQWSNYAGLR